MRDPSCMVCTPALCVHGEQSPTAEEVKAATVEERLAAVTAELAREKAAHLDTTTRMKRALSGEAAGYRALELARNMACGAAFDFARELERAHGVLANVAEVLRTPHPGITDVIWVNQEPRGPCITLYESVICVLPPDHPEVLRAQRGGS